MAVKSGIDYDVSYHLCEAEELRATGRVQAGFDVIAASADGTLSSTLPDLEARRVLKVLAKRTPDPVTARHGLLSDRDEGTWLHHRSGDAEIYERFHTSSDLADYAAPQAAALADAAGGNLWKLAAAMCRSIAKQLQADRVMVYRFHPDWAGEVIAEQISDNLESFLGLRYPPTDIPKQARDLFEEIGSRHIFSISNAPSNLTASRNQPQAVDLTHAVSRSVSPFHIEYLGNMGSAGTAAVGLMVKERLWGLLSIHYSQPRFPDLGEFLFLQATAVEVCAALEMVLEQEADREALRTATLVERFRRELTDEADLFSALMMGPNALHRVIGAQGASMIVEDHVCSVGVVPSDEAVEAILTEHGADLDEMEPLFVDRLPDALHGQQMAGLAGYALIRISRQPEAFVICFRDEVEQTVCWGGDPRRAGGVSGHERFTPRTSFQGWLERVKGSCIAWSKVHRDVLKDTLGVITECLEPDPHDIGVLLRNSAKRAVARSGAMRNASFEAIDGIQSAIAVGMEFSGGLPSDLLTINGAASDAFAIAPGEVPAMDLDDLEHLLGLKLAGKLPRRSTCTLQTVGRGQRECEVSVSLLFETRRRSDPDATVSMKLFEFTDVTEARRIENVLLAARNQAESNTRLMSAYFAKLNHELRTPLNALVGFSDLLMRCKAEQLDDGGLRWLEMITSSASLMADMLSTTLDNASAAHNVDVESYTPVSLLATAEEAAALLSPEAVAKQVQFAIDVPLSVRLTTDRRALVQVLLNVFSNAIKYNVPKGSIRLSVEEATAGFIDIHVSDTGIGMTEEELASAMEEFRRFSDRSVVGTGLGLSIVENLVGILGGRVSIASRKDHGTTVTLTLPYTAAARDMGRRLASPDKAAVAMDGAR